MNRRFAAASLAFALALGLAPAPARAVVRVFANLYPGSGTFQGTLQYGQSTRTFDVYVEIGSVDSPSPCRMGSVGDEVCAYDVALLVEGAGYIASFAPASSSVKSWPTSFTSNNVRTLGVAFVGANPAPSAPQPAMRIGTITVNGNAAGGTRLLVTGKKVIDAGLQPRIVPSATLAALPEPGPLVSLVSGVLGVAVLHRLRRRHAR
jgi:hypothetical protein